GNLHADVNFFTRWEVWSWVLAGGSGNYGARTFLVGAYSVTGTDHYQEPISPFTDFTGHRLTGLDSTALLVPYFQSRGIDLSQYTTANGLVTSWSMANGDT